VSPGTSSQAVRDVQCINAETWDVVSNVECDSSGEQPSNTSTFACATASTPKPKPAVLRWKSLDWDSDCNVASCTLQRQVLCVESEGTTETTVASQLCQAAGLPQPSRERSCVDDSVCTQPSGCLFGQLKCVRGTCSSESICVCPDGWGGPLCNTPATCTGDGAIMDRSGICCVAGMVDSAGDCCIGYIDRVGTCCLTSLDACGVCGGDALVVGLDGSCCASGVLDYGGMCCSAGWLDRCGVCAGSGLSCLIEVEATINVPTAVVKAEGPTSLGERVLLEAWLRESVENVTGVASPLRTFSLIGSKATTGSVQQGGANKRRLVNADEVLVDVVFGLLPSDGDTVLNVMASAGGGFGNLAAGAVSVEPRGICGNGICEARERCRTSQGIGCCPADCR
jgi:hypothetical protein